MNKPEHQLWGLLSGATWELCIAEDGERVAVLPFKDLTQHEQWKLTAPPPHPTPRHVTEMSTKSKTVLSQFTGDAPG